MSIWAANRAFQLDAPNQTHKLSLANFADDEDEARPHVKTLAKMASVSARSAFRALAAPMQVLDDDGVAVVVPLLRERLAAGWTASDLRAHLAANPIPDRVRHLAGLVADRLGKLPPEGAAPKPPPSRQRRSDPPSMPPLWPEERSPVAVRAEAARAEAIRTGSADAGRSRAWWLMRELNADKKSAEGTSGS